MKLERKPGYNTDSGGNVPVKVRLTLEIVEEEKS